MNVSSENTHSSHKTSQEDIPAQLAHLLTQREDTAQKLHQLSALEKAALQEFKENPKEIRHIGYIHLTEFNMNAATHIKALLKAGCKAIFHDVIDSNNEKQQQSSNPPSSDHQLSGFDKALSCLRSHDTLIICRLEELSPAIPAGNNLLLSQVEIIKKLFEEKINFLILSDPTTAHSPLNPEVNEKRIRNVHLLWAISIAFIEYDLSERSAFFKNNQEPTLIEKLAKRTRHYLNSHDLTDDEIKKAILLIGEESNFYDQLNEAMQWLEQHGRVEDLQKTGDRIAAKIGTLYR